VQFRKLSPNFLKAHFFHLFSTDLDPV